MHSGCTMVIHLGGQVMQNRENFESVLDDISISVFFCRAGCDSDWLSGLFPQVNLILKSYLKKCYKLLEK